MSFKDNLVKKAKYIIIRSDLAVLNANRKALIVGLGFIGLAVVGSLFVQFIDPNQIQVGFTD